MDERMGFRTVEVGALQIKSEEGNLSTFNKIQEELWRKTNASQCRARQRVGHSLVTEQTKKVSICKLCSFKRAAEFQKEYDEKM